MHKILCIKLPFLHFPFQQVKGFKNRDVDAEFGIEDEEIKHAEFEIEDEDIKDAEFEIEDEDVKDAEFEIEAYYFQFSKICFLGGE